MSAIKTFDWFRKVALIEGISFLVLLFIAMPLKYFMGYPMAVKIVGMAHGVLFVAFVYLAWEVKGDQRFSWGWFFRSFIASIIPFGTFVMDRQWKREEAVAKANG